MKLHLRISVLLMAGICMASAIQAQRTPVKKTVPAPAPPRADTVIKSTTLEVYQVYKPEIKPVVKPEFTPTLPPAATSKVPQQYDVPQQALYYTYRSLPLRPLALGKDTATPPPANYIKAGGGNLSTIYADIGIGSLHGPDWETAIHAHHISQDGELQGQRYLHTGLEASGVLHRNGHAWMAAIAADHRRVGLYGYDHSDTLLAGNDDVRLTYTGIDVQVGVKNEAPAIWGLDYAPFVRANIYNSHAIDGERTIELNVPVSKKIDSSLTAEIGLRGLFTQLSSDTANTSNNIFQITPAITYRYKELTAHFGLSPTIGRNGTAYLLPDISAAYKFSESLRLLAGWRGDLIQNTYQQLTRKNPFQQQVPGIRQSHNDEVFAMAEAAIGKHFTLSGKVSWWQFNNLPLYLKSYSGDGKSFYVTYDPRVNAWSLQLDGRYQVANTFSIGLSGAWYNYYKHTDARVWQEPAVRLKAEAAWQPIRELQLNAYWSLLDQIYALGPNNNEEKLKGVTDIGLGGEYQLIPQLSLFLNVDNLLNRKNERWLGYSSYGINIYGGLRFRF